MPTEEKMTIDERYKYLRMMKKRYRLSNHVERSRLLDEMEQVTGQHRKSLIRAINSDLTRQQRRKQRGRVYGIEVHAALKVISESFDFICAERLNPNLVWMAEHLTNHGELELSPGLLTQLWNRPTGDAQCACPWLGYRCRRQRDTWPLQCLLFGYDR